MRITTIVLLILATTTSTAQVKKSAANYFYYSPKILGDMAHLGTSEEIADLFDLKQGYRIADIGGGGGEYSCILSLMFDSIHFTVQDLDKKSLTKKKLEKNVSKFSKLRKSPQSCTFDFVIGTNMTTNLKDSSYDVLFLKSTFHEIGFVEEMIADMGKKLKRGGKIIMVDIFSTPYKSAYCKEEHRGYTIKEACILMEHHGLHLTGMRSPASDVPNYTNTLIFERDNEKSKIFIRGLYGTTGIENQIKRLSLPGVANDSIKISLLRDSVKTLLAPLQANYSCLESWLMGFGIVHFENKDYTAAKNIFNLVAHLYPKSYHAYYWLGEVFTTMGFLSNALDEYKKTLSLFPGHDDCQKKALKCHELLSEKKH